MRPRAKRGAGVPRRVCKLVDERADYRCERCGLVIFDQASRHHRKARSAGGENTVSNLVLVCGSGTTGCHGWLHAHPAAAREEGMIVPSWCDPALVPVKMWYRGEVYLREDGSAVRTAASS